MMQIHPCASRLHQGSVAPQSMDVWDDIREYIILYMIIIKLLTGTCPYSKLIDELSACSKLPPKLKV